MRRLLFVGIACVSVLLAVLVAPGTESALAGGGAPSATDVPSSSAVTLTKTVTRTDLVNGQSVTVDSNDITLNVSQTQNLRGRQEITVSWSGAHQTNGIVADQNSYEAADEEYPFVLLECRGTAAQVSPETCWTQSWRERYQGSFSDVYPPYRLDQYAASGDVTPTAGEPQPLPASCTIDEQGELTQRWIPFIGSNGQVYSYGNGGCAGEPAESTDVPTSGLPSNETFGVTTADGTGSAAFDVSTSAENASLGCSQTVDCSLVAVPIEGISCDPALAVPTSDHAGTTPAALAADVSDCEATGAYAPGSENPGTPGDLAVSGNLWWSASNWQNRMTVPLTFATPADACALAGSTKNVIDVYGSELMVQATGQWQPSICLDPASDYSFIHVQAGEPESRNLVAQGTAEAAFTSDAQPGGYGKPVVSAPVAVTGFAISYAIDGKNGQPYTTLRLTPLLLAKLLTESYPDIYAIQVEDPALAHNPLNLTEDPEFEALNPGVPDVGELDAAAELVAISGNSDVMQALTAYINADPTARAWLNGTSSGEPSVCDAAGRYKAGATGACPAMAVNPAYKGITLPVDQWPLLSTFEPKQYYQSDNNDCLYNAPVPYLPLVSAPLATLEDVSQNVQYDLQNSTTQCTQVAENGSSLGEKLTTAGRQSVGHRFVIGVTPLADGTRYQLQEASLETTPGTFVAPTDSSLAAAAALLKPDAATGTWPVPYSEFSQPAGAAAYPGTQVVYAAIPTKGLPSADAANYASLLDFIAGPGQTPGFGVGELPPGYLPLTAANGLAALDACTLADAKDVAAQNGQVPGVASDCVAQTTPATTNTSGTSTPAVIPLQSTGPVTGTSALPLVGLGGVTRTAEQSPRNTADKAIATQLVLGRLFGGPAWIGETLVILVLALAFFCVCAVPALIVSGRRRGRW